MDADLYLLPLYRTRHTQMSTCPEERAALLVLEQGWGETPVTSTGSTSYPLQTSFIHVHAFILGPAA